MSFSTVVSLNQRKSIPQGNAIFTARALLGILTSPGWVGFFLSQSDCLITSLGEPAKAHGQWQPIWWPFVYILYSLEHQLKGFLMSIYIYFMKYCVRIESITLPLIFISLPNPCTLGPNPLVPGLISSQRPRVRWWLLKYIDLGWIYATKRHGLFWFTDLWWYLSSYPILRKKILDLLLTIIQLKVQSCCSFLRRYKLQNSLSLGLKIYDSVCVFGCLPQFGDAATGWVGE